jgi:predicted extracellular nuclease
MGFGTIAKAQDLNCKKFKTGTFKMTFEGRNGIIKRTATIQEEYLNGSGKPTMTFTIKWLSDCKYTLTPTAATRKDFPDIPKDGTMTVQIIRTTPTSYTYSAVYSWDNKKTYENTVTLIK